MSLWSVLMGDGTFSLEVAGVVSCQLELEEIYQDYLQEDKEQIVLAILVPEDTNPYDPAAVRLQIRQRMVGYLSPADARAFRAGLGSAVQGSWRFRCRARIQPASCPTGDVKELWTV